MPSPSCVLDPLAQDLSTGSSLLIYRNMFMYGTVYGWTEPEVVLLLFVSECHALCLVRPGQEVVTERSSNCRHTLQTYPALGYLVMEKSDFLS